MARHHAKGPLESEALTRPEAEERTSPIRSKVLRRAKAPLVDVLAKVDLDRKKAVAAVVAAGALAGAGFTQAMATVGPADGIVPVAATRDLAAAMTGQKQAPQVLDVQTIHSVDTAAETRKLLQAEQIQAQFHVREALKSAEGVYVKRQEAAKAEAERVAAESARVAAESAARAAAETARAAAEAEAKRPQCVRPAQGSFTSGFG
ncbi:hypothetical protein SAMN05421507_13826, partial [Lentzea jiangxiensis]